MLFLAQIIALVVSAPTKRPPAHRTHVHMHELAARIVANATRVEALRRIPQVERPYAGHANIDRLALNMLRVLRHTRVAAASAQKVVAPRRAIATKDVDDALWPAQPR